MPGKRGGRPETAPPEVGQHANVHALRQGGEGIEASAFLRVGRLSFLVVVVVLFWLVSGCFVFSCFSCFFLFFPSVFSLSSAP